MEKVMLQTSVDGALAVDLIEVAEEEEAEEEEADLDRPVEVVDLQTVEAEVMVVLEEVAAWVDPGEVEEEVVVVLEVPEMVVQDLIRGLVVADKQMDLKIKCKYIFILCLKKNSHCYL